MDNIEAPVLQEEVAEVAPDTNVKHEFSAALLTEFWPAKLILPTGQSRRVYGITSDTPRSKRTRLYQSH